MTSFESSAAELDAPASPVAQEPSGKLFLGGLSWDTNEDTLREHFKKFGDIREAVVMRDRQTSRPRGFGFVTFEKAEVADAVVQQTHVVDGRQIDAKKSVPLEQKPKARKIFVGGLAPETTEEQFKAYFERFGEVAEAQIMLDHMSGRSRGFGFVTFAEDVSAERVFAAGAMHELKGKRVEVKPATPKGSTAPALGAGASAPPPPAGAPGAAPGAARLPRGPFVPAQAAGAGYGVQYHPAGPAGSHAPYVVVPYGGASSGPYGAAAPAGRGLPHAARGRAETGRRRAAHRGGRGRAAAPEPLLII
ncbi:hypothetical protein QBZ16_005375 [Prototheca wickerhamii]|uniref:RRM domain-containing protein n=1 Tax=Prototheca wickerhamii TaxID=3111 RepID=A0AAD9IG60_PROWI|nr:hypothetical protein QBZ16_005375 [Prototheca wickerhamii]